MVNTKKVSWNQLERKIKTFFVGTLLSELDQLINAEDVIDNKNDFVQQSKGKPAKKQSDAEEDEYERGESDQSDVLSSDSASSGGFYVDEKGEDFEFFILNGF